MYQSLDLGTGSMGGADCDRTRIKPSPPLRRSRSAGNIRRPAHQGAVIEDHCFAEAYSQAFAETYSRVIRVFAFRERQVSRIDDISGSLKS
jgi:hypothetical protein